MMYEFLKECKATIRSIPYLVLCIVLIVIYFSQYREDVSYDLEQAHKGILFEESRWGETAVNLMVKPVPGMESYGRTAEEIPDQVMRNVSYRLFRDISNNRFDAYFLNIIPFRKDLTDEDLQRVRVILEKITGQPLSRIDAVFYEMDLQKVLETRDMTQREAVDYLRNDYYIKLAGEFRSNDPPALLIEYHNYMPVRKDLSYDEFKKLLREAKSIIRGRTLAYEDLSGYGSVPIAYENALADYNHFVYKDKVSGAYARQFCKSMVGAAVILSALFAAVTAVSGTRRLFLRFLAIAALSFLPVFILAIAATMELAFGVSSLGLKINCFAFAGYSLVWLLPAILAGTAAGLFFAMILKKIRDAGVLRKRRF